MPQECAARRKEYSRGQQNGCSDEQGNTAKNSLKNTGGFRHGMKRFDIDRRYGNRQNYGQRTHDGVEAEHSDSCYGAFCPGCIVDNRYKIHNSLLLVRKEAIFLHSYITQKRAKFSKEMAAKFPPFLRYIPMREITPLDKPGAMPII